MKVGFPESVKKIFSIMAENGYECFLVGVAYVILF